MIYHLLYPLTKYFSPFNITQYITFRAGCAFIVSFILVMVFWENTVARLKRLKITEKIDMYGNVYLESLHEGKKGTPTMGGILIVFSVVMSTLMWARLDNYFIWLSMIVILSLAYVGFKDDYLKIKKGKGLCRRDKLICQLFIGAVVSLLIVMWKGYPLTINFPFFKRWVINLGHYWIFYMFWVVLMLVSTSNAVNFTDGLDGLAIGALTLNFLLFAGLCYVVGRLDFSEYLYIPYIKGAGELSVLCLSLVGAGLGFLWFNSYPAEVFMGDVGALPLGGITGMIALFIKKEFLLFISGGLFVIEGMSVVLQILSVRLRGKRVFKAAPIHHHLQLLGWKEPKIIVRLWILASLCAVVSLLTLKLR